MFTIATDFPTSNFFVCVTIHVTLKNRYNIFPARFNNERGNINNCTI